MSYLYRPLDGHPPTMRKSSPNLQIIALLTPHGLPYNNCIKLWLPSMDLTVESERTYQHDFRKHKCEHEQRGHSWDCVKREQVLKRRRKWEEMRATVRGPPRAGGWNARRELEHDSKDSSTTGVWYWRGDSGPFPRAYTMCHARLFKLRNSDIQSRLIRTSFQSFKAMSVRWLNYVLLSYFKLHHTDTRHTAHYNVNEFSCDKLA